MKSILIQGYNFDAPEPYSAGHVLTEVESGVLNQTFAENLRNNFAGDVKDAIATHGKTLPAEVVESLRDSFESYAKTYQFGVRRAGEVDPVRLIRNKADAMTDEQKQAIAAALGLEFKPKKK